MAGCAEVVYVRCVSQGGVRWQLCRRTGGVPPQYSPWHHNRSRYIRVGVCHAHQSGAGAATGPHPRIRRCQGRRNVYRLVWRAELHGRPRRLHHRTIADPHRPDQSRPAGRRPSDFRPKILSVAEVLKPLGYATGQFGKNHLGDRNEYLPTVHGFDEFFGNLYHLNAEEEPENPDYPKDPSSARSSGRAACSNARHDRRPTVDPPTAGRQAGDRKHRPARHQAHGDGGRGIHRLRRSISSTASTRRTRRGSATSTRRACMSGRI